MINKKEVYRDKINKSKEIRCTESEWHNVWIRELKKQNRILTMRIEKLEEQMESVAIKVLR